MVGGTQRAHGIDEDGHFVRVDVRRDAMAEIEDMAGAAAITFQYIGNAFLNLLRGFTQGRRIEITL